MDIQPRWVWVPVTVAVEYTHLKKYIRRLVDKDIVRWLFDLQSIRFQGQAAYDDRFACLCRDSL